MWHRLCVTAVPFSKTSPALAFNKAEGLLIGWLCFSDKDGEPYVDLHGDHFPADELFKAADELMAKPASERMLNIEHAGGGVGEIRTVYAVTPEIAKAHGWDTGGTYGLVGSVKPDAALMKSIASGDLACFSIEGKALDVEIVKSADGIAATAHKRTMRKVSITKLALVKAGAHEGAGVALIKTAATALRIAGAFTKATPALTSVDAGHQHVISDIDASAGATGSTSGENDPTAPGGYGWHSHLWVRADDGSITIAVANNHTHTLLADTSTAITESATMPTPADETVAKSLHTAEIAKRDTRISTLGALLLACAALPLEQAAFVKTLPAEKVEGFLALPEAERVAKATPIYKAADGELFYAGDERNAKFAKRADEAEADKATAGYIAKAKDLMPKVQGTAETHAFVIRSIEKSDGTTEQKAAAVTMLKASNGAFALTQQAPGFGGNGNEPAGALAALDTAAETFAKSVGKPVDKVYDQFLASPDGQRLYAAYKAETDRARG